MAPNTGDDRVDVEYPDTTARTFNEVSRLSSDGGRLSATAPFDAAAVEQIADAVVDAIETWADDRDAEPTAVRERDEDGEFDLVLVEAGVVRCRVEWLAPEVAPEEVRATVEVATHDPAFREDYDALVEAVADAVEWNVAPGE